jgi:hypothetical protein
VPGGTFVKGKANVPPGSTLPESNIPFDAVAV